MKKEMYATSDFYLACFLLSKECELSVVQSVIDNPKKKSFVFVCNKQNDIAKLADTFYTGTGSISVKKYVHCIKDLKSILYKN
ncbi:MAG: hypothetical protein A2452_12205 [Candidatus Firestonebacteria bacterium RIFOXYC2_FULL_39_67]|nr:MAG: hypothetical protein A2536_07735 [Candidatus Firestonebacteria bacterium RIFOXYD2_FULL_39_29]OGF55611.1 MAG: hypothetical protein A2452_12205 [Candidatus Firestonebacteria bacterium RIFOXYC2_FULL_39_67]